MSEATPVVNGAAVPAGPVMPGLTVKPKGTFDRDQACSMTLHSPACIASPFSDVTRTSERTTVALSDVGRRWAEGYGDGKEGYW